MLLNKTALMSLKRIVLSVSIVFSMLNLICQTALSGPIPIKPSVSVKKSPESAPASDVLPDSETRLEQESSDLTAPAVIASPPKDNTDSNHNAGRPELKPPETNDSVADEFVTDNPGSKIDDFGYSASDTSDAYYLGVGDVFTVSVWQNPDLTRQLVVLPDGNVHFPLIGQVAAAGNTVSSVRDHLKEGLSRFLVDPVLTVTVDQATSMVIYVIGKVNYPGSFPVIEAIDVLQAISLAGGVNPFADKDEIRVLRENGDKTLTYEFDYDEVTEGENTDQNIMLERGDVVVVP